MIVPTRELAIQVTDDLNVAGGKLGSRVLSVYGGRAYEPQIDALKQGVEAVVGTPGRLLDLLKQKYLDLSQVSVLVLDEADRMLDLGFLPDIERLVDKVPAVRQTMLFSATMPGEIVALSRKYLTRPTNVRAESHEESEATPQVVQHVFQAHQMDKPELLARVLQADSRGLTMVFCQTKRACDRVAEDLSKRGFAAAAVHGDLGQGQRERALRAFRAGKIDVLVATDVAARGLDVDDVTHVVNYECPDAADTYVHRIGRTGRAGKEGISVTLVDWKDLQRWKLINTALDLGFADPAETYSTSDHLYEALDIPTGITGTLPKAQRDRAGLEAEEVEDIGETGRSRSPRREERAAAAAPRQPRRRNRTRTRTRGGRPVEGEATDEVTVDDTETPVVADTRDDAGTSEAPERKRPARRRERAAVTTTSPETPEQETSMPDAAGSDASPETPEKAAPVREAPTSLTPAGVPVVEFMPPPIDPTAEVDDLPEPMQPKPKRRRRTRKGGARESA